jgi:glycosidase
MWIDEFNIDGLRLDAADCLDLGFISDLATFCKKIRPDFWLMGEIIHGDYNHWIKAGLDSVTNYECYKGLYSSHNDINYFEIAYALNRQFGEHGIYRDFLPYTFADNHDVDRVASILKSRTHLYPLYILLFTMPGIPSIYYGSESGTEGKRTKTSDNALRPMLELVNVNEFAPETNLIHLIKKLSNIRHSIDGLKIGTYQQLHVNHEQLVFWRKINQEYVIVALNSSNQRINLEITLPEKISVHIKDRLNEQEQFEIINGKLKLFLWPNWGRILTPD